MKEVFGGDEMDYLEICEKFKQLSLDELIIQLINDESIMSELNKH